MTKLKDIIDFFGDQKGWAEAMKISPASLSCMLHRQGLPAKRAIHTEQLSEGKFKAADIVGIMHDDTRVDYLTKQR